ncbi:MAG: hypothetical protein V4604_12605 [Bacteroidota bacterium]
MKLVAIISLGLLFFTACKKVEGEGGSGSITGKINIQDYNANQTVLLSEYAGFKEDVYIIYGTGDNTFDDKIEASYDGSFEFKYLEPGTYTIFAYSDCLTCNGGEEAIKMTVTVDKKKATDIGTINLKK